MPTRAQRPCAHHGCPALVASGLCDQHRKAYDVQRGNSAERNYGSHWRRVRAAVLREEPLCRECAREGRTTAAREIDHIIPRSKGGTEDRDNLQGLCKPCHSAKTMRESVNV
jgi:5-methylcytosine-specific restriction protein A